jgi:cyanate permease
MLGLVWLLYFVFGVVSHSVAPLVTPIIRDLNISYSQMGIILGTWQATYILAAIGAGALIDRWGIRKSLLLGILLIGASEALRYFATGFATMFLFVALFGVGGPMISIGCPKMVSQWFSGKGRGTAAGIYQTGPWIGGLVAYSTTNSVVMPLTDHSWRLTFLVFSVLAFAAAFLWWLLARDMKTAEAAPRASLAETFTSLIKVRNVQLILIMGYLSFSVSHGFNNWLPKILETSGLPPAMAGYAASIHLFVGIPALLLIPRLVPPHWRGRTLALMSLAVAIALGIVATNSGAPLITGLVLYGLSFACVLPFLMLILMELPEVGSRYMGSVGGMFFCVAEIGGFSGPFIVGAIRDMTGNFLAGMGFVVALAFVMSIVILLVRTRPASKT